MDSLESKPRILTTERQRVINDLNCIAYVLTLPPEITSEIFSHYILEPRLGPVSKWAPSTPSRGPLTLAAVCRNWRHICFSTPCLWASLHIYPKDFWVADDFIQFLKCWLQRAGNHPLELNVEWSPKLTRKILPVIFHYSHQLRTLAFSLYDLYGPDSFPKDKIGDLPLLMKLAVDIVPSDLQCHAMTAFREAPRLREVHLSSICLPWMPLPWIQLTHLEFGDSSDSPSGCIRVLGETPNLEVLNVSLTRMAMEPSTLPPPHLTLPCLHTLKYSDRHHGMLLRYLVLPALKMIHLLFLQGPGISSFIDLGVRSAWSLRSMELQYMTLIGCTTCLESLPSVTRLVIWIGHSQDLNKLAEHFDKEMAILPALETLVFRDCRTDVSACRLRTMLMSRWSRARDGEGKLKSFQLQFTRHMVVIKEFVEGLWLELRPLMDAGLEVSIDFPSA